jgi:hypothetical protein
LTGRAGPNGRGTSIGSAPRSESSATARLGASLAIVAGLAVGVVAAVVLRAERRLGAEPSGVLNALSESFGHRIDAQAVDISYWPPGIVATGVSVSDESPFGPGSLLRADELELRASPWALLRGRLVMDEVRLVRPAARLVRGEDGRWNTESSQPRPQARTARAPGRGTAAEVEIETVRVRGGRIRYRDRALPSAAEVEVDDVNLLFTRDEGLALDFNASALGGGPESVSRQPPLALSRARHRRRGGAPRQLARGGARAGAPRAVADSRAVSARPRRTSRPRDPRQRRADVARVARAGRAPRARA